MIPAQKKKKSRPGEGLAPQAEISALREAISDLVIKNPTKAAIILTGWLNKTQKPATKPLKKVG